MKLKKFDDFTYIFLVNASQMAYIEDAPRTHDMLQKFNELYRYMIRDEADSMLEDELKALRNYAGVQTLRYEGRFSLTLENPLENSDTYIKHLCLLDFADNIVSSALTQFESHFQIRFELSRAEKISMTAAVEAGDRKETFRITLTEEVK